MADVWASRASTAVLLAELERRQEETKPACGSKKGASEYNTSAHVFALILILTVSTIGCGFPLVSRRSSQSTSSKRIIFISQHFGTGVLIATAFVHLLPTAFNSLTDPCLPWFWNEGYEAMPGLISMLAIFTVVGIEQFLRWRGARSAHAHEHSWDPIESEDNDHDHNHNVNHGRSDTSPGTSSNRPRAFRNGMLSAKPRPKPIALHDIEASEGLVNGASPLPVSTPVANGSSHKPLDEDEGDSDLDLEELDPTGGPRSDRGDDEDSRQIDSDEQQRLLLQCLLLEAGILFHSVFIGLAVSVSSGPAFVVFLIAISFHQLFEGLGLGARIAAIKFPKSSPRPWLMCLAFGLTTPAGQLLGIFIHTLYDPRSEAGLLIVGIMNAISSGLLLFAGLVQLLSEDFLSDKSYGVLTGKKRVYANLAVLSGSVLMALVGVWA